MTDELVSEPQKRKSVWPFVAVGVVLMAVGLGLALWKVTEDDEPDYEADCALIEEKAPDLGPALAEILAGLERGQSEGREETVEGVGKANEVYRDMADDLTDRDFAEELDAFADRSDKIADGMREGNLNVAASELPEIMSFGNTAVKWLDEHCPRWVGPGQWGEPGSDPTGPTELPTFPTDISMPTDLPSLPSELPSMPSLPSLPSDLPTELPTLPE